MSEPLRVLHFQGRMGKGGAETFMMNTYRNIDRSKIQFDFLIYHDFKDVTPYNKEIERLGGRIFSVPNPKKHPLGYIKAVKKLLHDHHFDIVHNEVFFGGGLNLRLAYNSGIAKRIAHSHATTDGNDSIVFKTARKFLDKWLFKYATDFLACSTEAGVGLFGEHQPFIFVPNGIDLQLYQAFPESKNESRRKLGISEEHFVIGNIGRFEKQKNHSFLIDIFNEIIQIKPESTLLLIGEGSLEEEIKEKVNRLNLTEAVCFMGVRDDIPRILNAMDVLVMPSLYEGLPISAVEAQAAGLKLVLSKEVSRETVLSENVIFESLQTSPRDWAQSIINEPLGNNPLPEMKQYGKQYTADLMQSIYLGEEIAN
ncbi:glycosyltransferase family 1 protein [Alkalibacterium olivapovliticus]|uniref:Glycosyltransferase involved in cell wall biosynthesis n=1 Tax=Alkalibacterium olivapovliticus TaxID=99907 RepID=A0A2T0W7N1_9LACT|nr:glycosyltransferase family 1 protein [Alkalibacterium olivapovliticus]PRY82703.1 glycosyltransferase involved in cell wall biosynthesis [Alkalibacterium olivapovliticus]